MKKSCRLYLVRHGQTEWNIEGRMQGQKDSSLTAVGISQAEAMGLRLKSVNFAAAFSSDLLRAYRTAQIIAKERRLAVIARRELRERSFGKLDGKLVSQVRKELEQFYHLYTSLPEPERRRLRFYSEGESDEQLMGRFITVLREIALAYLGKNVLVVTHGAVMRVFLIHLGYGDDKTLPSGSVKNTALVKLESDGVEFEIKRTVGVELAKI